MDLHAAADAFVAGWTATRRLNGPFEVATRGEARWLHDPTGRRMGELVGVDMAPERLVSLYPSGKRCAISALLSGSTEEPKRAFRALGWRLLRTEPMFVHRLRDLPPLDPRVVRARGLEHVARIARAAGKRPETWGVEDVDDAAIRLYEASVDGQNVGRVRSVRAGKDAWVAALLVEEAFRRQGYGRGLMAALLADDARLGRRSGVLLASHAGARLYATLGYERIGTMLILMPIKVSS